MTSSSNSDTIVAQATAKGVGSISIVRISGKKALEIGSKLISKKLSPRVATLCDVYTRSGHLLDRAILIYYQAPKSYTTEDVVEFQTHGGDMVASMLLDEILSFGARLARPGEFSKRAYLGGRVDSAELETTAALINAKSEEAARLLAKQLDGGLKSELWEYREKLIEILAYTEVSIDYAEEDLPKDISDKIKTNLASVTSKLESIINATKARSTMFDGYKLSIIGRPNVGKSSLLNKLLMYDRAIVSDIEGTTRDTIEESLKIGTHLVRVVDTAGIRDGLEEIEKKGIERTFASARNSEIILALFDSSEPLKIEDKKVIEFIKSLDDKKIFIVLTKCDLDSKIETRELDIGYEKIHISKDDDLGGFNEKLLEYLDKNADYQERVLVSKRQLDVAIKGLDALFRAKSLLEGGESELFAYEIKDALEMIKSIDMPSTNEDVLDKIFSTFCLGK